MATTFFNYAVREGPMEYSVAVDGIAVFRRTWFGKFEDVVAFSNAIRTNMPALPFNVTLFVWDAKGIDVKITHKGGEEYQCTVEYQGYFNLPFTVYEWRTERTDRPIAMHPNFTTAQQPGNIMKQDVHWKASASSLQFEGFSATILSGLGIGTRNPYVGIESYPVATGYWRKTSFSKAPEINVTQLWKHSAPELGPWTGIGIPDPNNIGDTLTRPWIKTKHDSVNTFRGASPIWQTDQEWWWNSLGWMRDIYA